MLLFIETVDTTADLIRESEELERRLIEEKRILEVTRQQKERLIQGQNTEKAASFPDANKQLEPEISKPQQNGRKSPVTEKPATSDGSYASF